MLFYVEIFIFNSHYTSWSSLDKLLSQTVTSPILLKNFQIEKKIHPQRYESPFYV